MEPLFDNLVQQWIDKISVEVASEEGTLDLASWSKRVLLGFTISQT